MAANPVITRTILGDIRPIDTNAEQEGIQAAPDALLNPVGTPDPYQDSLFGSPDHDHIQSGEQLDLIMSGEGDDWIEGGNDHDYLYADNGNDLLEGGAGTDILIGGNGDDRLYANSKITTATAIANGQTDLGSGQTGEWLAGGAGEDLLVAGADNDLLSGGAGSDLIVAGAGDDLVFGDADYTARYFMVQPVQLRYRLVDGGWFLDWNTISPESFHWTYTNTDGNIKITSPVIGEGKPAGGAADVIYAGKGNDDVWAGEGNDVVFGEAGDDRLIGDEGNDVLLGGAGQDKLWGGTENDYLDGGDDADELYGNEGDDILIGGKGDDTLQGGAGQDIYIFNKGDGTDVVVDTQSDNNLFRFGAGVNQKDIKLRLGSLMLDLGGGDAVHIDGFDQNDVFNSSSISGFEFADGSALTTAQLLERGFDIDGSAGDDPLVGTNTVDRLSGFDGDDVLDGGDGDDVLTGGAGCDMLAGGAGNDTYVFAAGDGGKSDDGAIETLCETDGEDTVRFDGINANSLRLSTPDALTLQIDYGGSDNLRIDGGTVGVVENFIVGNEHLTASQLIGRYADTALYGINADGHEVVTGGRGNDTLDAAYAFATLSGGLGNDTLSARGGYNTYLYDLGDGQDTIIDSSAQFGRTGANTLRFGTGIGVDDLKLYGDNGALLIKVGDGDANTIRIENFGLSNPDSNAVIHYFTFADGTSLDRQGLLARGIELIGGSGVGKTLTGFGKNDRLYGGGDLSMATNDERRMAA